PNLDNVMDQLIQNLSKVTSRWREIET
ncbi:hypothetical protein SZ25_00888, partial [Candidatus Arcanobacter lacustris]